MCLLLGGEKGRQKSIFRSLYREGNSGVGNGGDRNSCCSLAYKKRVGGEARMGSEGWRRKEKEQEGDGVGGRKEGKK